MEAVLKVLMGKSKCIAITLCFLCTGHKTLRTHAKQLAIIFHIFLFHSLYNVLSRLSQFTHKAWKLKYSSETFDAYSKFQDMIWEWILNVHEVGGVRERIIKTCQPVSSCDVTIWNTFKFLSLPHTILDTSGQQSNVEKKWLVYLKKKNLMVD